MSTEPQVYFQDRWEGVDDARSNAPHNIPPGSLRKLKNLKVTDHGDLAVPWERRPITYRDAFLPWGGTDTIDQWFVHQGEVYGRTGDEKLVTLFVDTTAEKRDITISPFSATCSFIEGGEWAVIFGTQSGKLKYAKVPGAGEVLITTSPAPARDPFVHGNCLWCLTNAGGDIHGPSDRLVFSAVDDPTNWPAGNYIAVEPEGAAIVKCFSTGTAILIFKEDSIWLYRGVGGVTSDTLTRVANFGTPRSVQLAEGRDAFFALLQDGSVHAISKSGQSAVISAESAVTLKPLIFHNIVASKTYPWLVLNSEKLLIGGGRWQTLSIDEDISAYPGAFIFPPITGIGVDGTPLVAYVTVGTALTAYYYLLQNEGSNMVNHPSEILIESGQLFFENDQTGRFDHKRLSRVWLGVNDFVNTGTGPVCKIEFYADDAAAAFAEIDFVAADFLSGVEKWKHIPDASTVAARSYRWKITVTPGTGGSTDFGLSAIAIEFTNLGVQ